MNSHYQILLPEWIVTVNSSFEVLRDCAVVVLNDRILSIVTHEELPQLEYYQQAEIIELPGSVLMPGLINSHTHASMSLFRGIADDLPLMDWLGNHIWPAESKWVNAEFIADGFELASAEMMRSGTTCLNDMYFFPDIVARSAERIGMRTVVGLIVLDFPTVWAKDAEEYLHKAMAVHDEVRELTMVTSAFAPHAPYTVSDGPLQQIAMFSSELDIPVHMHIHETTAEVDKAQQETGMRPLERLDQLNLLNSNLIAVHMTELNDFEIERVAEAAVNIVHCPQSNLKLGSGLCPVSSLLAAGINLCLGTDGAASNNDLDMFDEMRTAALLAKGLSGDAASCNSRQSIEMATINGARALGIGDRVGSIEVGKLADLIALDMSALNTQPLYDPVDQIVYALNSRQVSHVWINGKCQLKDFELCHLDQKAITRKAAAWAGKISH